MTEFTTEQYLPVTFAVVDGRGRQKAVDGTPVVVSSDETIATVTELAPDGMNWIAKIVASTPGDARVTFTGDADLGAGVQDVVGFIDFTVTLDPRTGARMVALTAGAPADKAV